MLGDNGDDGDCCEEAITVDVSIEMRDDGKGEGAAGVIDVVVQFFSQSVPLRRKSGDAGFRSSTRLFPVAR